MSTTETPPTGPPPSYPSTFPIVNNDQRAVLGVAITFTILPVIFVFLRFLAHRLANRKPDLSDLFIVFAAILAVSLEAVSITGVHRAGIGYGHVLDVVLGFGPEPLVLLAKLLIPLQILWAVSLSCSKVSALLLYTRVFAVPNFKRAAWALMGFIAAWAIGTVLAGLLICRPISMNWAPDTPGGTCGDQVLSFTITGVINLLTDVAVLAMPMPFLYKLQLPLYKKLVLVGVFSVGGVACVISGYRIYTLRSMDFNDITYSIPLANIFSGLEPSIAVVLACIPVLRPLLGRSAHSPQASAQHYGHSGISADRNLSKNGMFEPLGDNGSEHQLRPVQVKTENSVGVEDRHRRRGSSDGSSNF